VHLCAPAPRAPIASGARKPKKKNVTNSPNPAITPNPNPSRTLNLTHT